MQFQGVKKNQSGMSLAEVVVSIGIISVLILAVFSLVQYVLTITAENKFRLGAIMVADQKMERIKNLPYDQIGTLTGIVHGQIPDNEVTVQNNGTFYINTLVQYIDDPFDGTLGGSPVDPMPTDYKQVRVRVRWFGNFGQKEVSVYTKIAPRGMENDAGGGILSITVFNASGQPVSEANVHIENNSLSPIINLDAATNQYGILDFPGAPPSIEGYELTITKAGYSTSSTTARTLTNPNPTQPNATVLVGEKTDLSYAVDLTGNLTIKTVQQDLPDNFKINTDATEENQVYPRLIADNSGYLYFIWQDFRNGTTYRNYMQKYDTDGNAQWSPADILISGHDNQEQPDIKISTSSGELYVGWNDNSAGNQDVYLEKRSSANGSSLWSGAKNIESGADSADQTHLRIAVYNLGLETITAAWQDNRNGNTDIYLLRYDDNKNKLWANAVKANKNSDPTDQYEPQIAIDSLGNIYTVWTDGRNGNPDIFASKHDADGQAVWTDDVKINSDSGSSNQYSPAIAIDASDNIYFAWTDERNGNKDIYFAKFNADGQPVWLPTDKKVNVYTDSNQFSPGITLDSGGNIYISWTDERSGNQDIFSQKFDLNGNRIWSEDIRLNINLGLSNQLNSSLTLNPINDKVYSAWQDERNGNFNIYAGPAESYGPVTAIANVPLTITGAKKIGENPVIFKFFKKLYSNSVGQVVLSDAEWDTYDIALSSGYSAYDIVMTSKQNPIIINPNTTQEIILYLDN